MYERGQVSMFFYENYHNFKKLFPFDECSGNSSRWDAGRLILVMVFDGSFYKAYEGGLHGQIKPVFCGSLTPSIALPFAKK